MTGKSHPKWKPEQPNWPSRAAPQPIANSTSPRALGTNFSSLLVLKPPKGFVNEPLPLSVFLSDASGSEKVILAGLAIGTRLSAGTPVGLTSWEMLAREAVDALVYPPKDFVGIMVAVIDLRSHGDWLMDSQIIRFEWIRKDKERSST